LNTAQDALVREVPLQANVQRTRRPQDPELLPVVLLHGLLSTTREFGLISLPLQSRGVELIVPDIKGYTEANRRRFNRWESWVDAACDAIREQVGVGRPFVLGGLCTGSMLAAAVAARGEFNVRSLAMMAPTFGYDGWGRGRWWGWRKLGYVLGFDRWVHVPETAPYGIKNEKIRRWVERDMESRSSSSAGPSTLPLWAINQSEQLMRHVVKQLPTLKVPTTIMSSTEDEICSISIVRDAFNTLPGDANRLVVLENSYHMITMDNDRQLVTAELLKCAGKTERTALEAVESRASGASHSPAGILMVASGHTGTHP
jgi:carboxylesterase